MRLRIAPPIPAACALAACGFVHDERLTGPYRAVAVDVDEQMSVCEGQPHEAVHCVVLATVFAIGHDDDFIIAKRHPMNEPTETAPDKSITEFWIVRTGDGLVMGPLDEHRFEVERARLGVPADVDFSIVYDDLQ